MACKDRKDGRCRLVDASDICPIHEDDKDRCCEICEEKETCGACGDCWDKESEEVADNDN